MADDVGVYQTSVVSVGESYAKGGAVVTDHPQYRSFVDSVDARAAELAARRAAARSSNRAVAVTVNLDTVELSTLSEVFPEFNLVNYGSGRPGHAWLVQFRRLANEWLMSQAVHFSHRITHLGGSALAYLLMGSHEAQLLVDPLSPTAVHERHSVSLDAYRIFQNYAVVAKDLGVELKRAPYEAFLRRELLPTVFPAGRLAESEVVCHDGMLYPYSPHQVASLMMLTEAKITFGFFIYHPDMLMADEGELPGGFFFKRIGGEMHFRYPEGAAGTVKYAKGVWESWLVSHVFSVGAARKRWFQLELLKARGPCMFYRMTELPCEPQNTSVAHALEIEGAEDKYVVHSWELKSLGLDPYKQDSWECKPFLVSRRIVDRVYQFGMQLPSDQFTRYAIRKQIHVVNDRVTIEGTSVRVNSSLGTKIVDSLVVALYSRVFVDRYESGTLTQEAMNVVKQLAGFSSTSFSRRAWLIARLCCLTAWDYTFGYVNNVVRDASDWVRTVLGSARVQQPQIADVPPYVLLNDVTANWLVGRPMLAAVADWNANRAASESVGFASKWAKSFAQMTKLSVPKPFELGRYRVEQVGLFDNREVVTEQGREFLRDVRALNPVDEAPIDRYALEVEAAVRLVRAGRKVDFDPDADAVYTLNEFYLKACPGVSLQNLEYDTASVSLDPQDRSLAAPYLRLPKYFGDAPRSRSYYPSRLKALNVPKRQGTLQELVSSIAARNLNAPQVSLPEDEEAMAVDIWETFLDEACLPDARAKLAQFQADPIGLEMDGLADWVKQADPAKVAAAKAELERNSQALEEMPVDEYLVMLKSDVKPTLSTKPLESRTEPQVIVYHEKALSALYSSMYRVLVRRFLALLKPNYHVNLLKDTRDIEGFLNSVHPFGADVQYLENDFSKYDKSQGRFVFKLESLVFQQLGMNQEMLDRWLHGHVECSLRSVALGLSLHVMYQRKSGDATTSFGNVLLNILSVTYAYRGTSVIWALFMGDDSLVCAREIGAAEVAVRVLAEVFNLGAKTYITKQPYFASNFVLIDTVNESIALVPDPVKRIERWSMAVSAENPQWEERFVSAHDSMRSYLNVMNTALLPMSVASRYPVEERDCYGIADAVATLLSDQKMFRSIWYSDTEVSNY